MQAFFGCRHGAVPTAGFSGRAAHVVTAFLVGIASDALVQAFFLLIRVWEDELEACTARLDRLVDQIAALRPGK